MAVAEQIDAFAEQVGRIRASGVLGRSAGLSRLFDYLAAKAAAGVMLREVDIAQDVFGRSVDMPGDASVRVYVHRLRRKLERFYEGEGRAEPAQLSIPVGTYRLVARERPADEIEAAAVPVAATLLKRRWLLAGALGLLLAINTFAWLLVSRQAAPARELAQLVETPLWAGFAHDRPALVVIGDYYIFGDTEGEMQPVRMLREFDVNSPSDLETFLMSHPKLQERYVDMDTYYTPVGATLAMREIMPLVHQAAGGSARVRVITSSQLQPDMLKTNDIVYIGYLSALGILRDQIFAASRFQIGDSFDEVIDTQTGKTYVSGAGEALSDESNRDYGYLAAVRGPTGNRIIAIAGTRDIGVMETAQIASDKQALAALQVRRNNDLAALYEVQGMGRTNFTYRLVSDRKGP
jgi:hypothetical protein